MIQYSFDDERDRAADWLERGAAATRIMVRLCGFVLMAVGLWIGLGVISESWGLYHEPQRIEAFAQAVEAGSHLDRVVGAAKLEDRKDADASAAEAAAAPKPAAPDNASFRLSYFAAWMLAILLLMLIGRLAIAAVKTGGELVLYDLRMKRFAKAIVEELGRPTPR